jgi:DNA invertase Pin-like site-specific DNA recombinase
MIPAQYARYSTDNQRPTSIEDQLAGGRARCVREGWPEPLEYSDGAVSASLPIESREGSSQLMRDAAVGKFNLLLIEALDRFSRDVVDQERMVRRLEFRGIRIVGLVDGYDSLLQGREMFRVVRGSFNQETLRDIAKKTHRGLAGQISRGYHAGGISYGYRSEVAGLDAAGEPIGHRLVIEPEAANWVRWIFEQYADGSSLRAIVCDLNRRRVPAPRGGTWAASALFGSPAKGSGVINNELYIGHYIWNRSKWIKDPDTGRRQRIARPREEWSVTERPELRIVDDAIWQRVRARMDRGGLRGGGRGKGARPRTLFGGLLKCGKCGGAVIAVNVYNYGCAAHKDRGASVCTGMHAKRKIVDARLLTAVREDLLAPEAVIELQHQVAAILADRQRSGAADGHAARARLAELEREIANLVDAVAAAGWSGAIRERLQEAEEERARLRTAAAARKPTQARLAGVVGRYKVLLMDLQATLAGEPERARQALQDLLGEIRLVPEGKELYAEIETRHERLLMAAGGEFLRMVAGAGFVTRKRIRVA